MKELMVRVRYPREESNPHASGLICQPTGYWCDWVGAYYMNVDGFEGWPLDLIRKEGVRYPETSGCCCPEAVVLRGLPAAVRALVERTDAEVVDELDDDYTPSPTWQQEPVYFGEAK